MYITHAHMHIWIGTYSGVAGIRQLLSSCGCEKPSIDRLCEVEAIVYMKQICILHMFLWER